MERIVEIGQIVDLDPAYLLPGDATTVIVWSVGGGEVEVVFPDGQHLTYPLAAVQR